MTFMQVPYNKALLYDHSQPHCRGITKKQAYDRMARFFVQEMRKVPDKIGGLNLENVDGSVVERRWNALLKTVYGGKTPAKVHAIDDITTDDDADAAALGSSSTAVPPKVTKTKFSRSTGHGVFSNSEKIIKSPFDHVVRDIFGKNPRFDPVAVRSYGRVSKEGSRLVAR